jgi:RNA polymerase sigma-70 factor (ECF subfamily)
LEAPLSQDPEVQRALEALLSRARARWPALPADPGGFLRHLAGREREAAGVRAALGSAAALDHYLAFSCLTGSAAALAAFEEEHLRPVGAYLAHIDRSPAFADEVRQALRAKLLAGGGGAAGLSAYSGRGALGGWVRVAALRVALNLKRGERRVTTLEAAASSAEQALGANPELRHLRDRYREPFLEALRQAVGNLADHDRALLRLYHGEGLALDALAGLYRVHPSTISRRLAAARERIAAETLRRLREATGASDSDAGSIAALVLSQVDASLLRLLGEGP